MTNPTRSFTANTTATNTHSTLNSVQASAYQQGTATASPTLSASTSGNTANISGACYTTSGAAARTTSSTSPTATAPTATAPTASSDGSATTRMGAADATNPTATGGANHTAMGSFYTAPTNASTSAATAETETTRAIGVISTSSNGTTGSNSTFAGVASAALNSSMAKSSISCTTSITNLTVSSLEETVTFYTNVFGWEVDKMTESYALLTNGTSSVCAITEDYATEVYGFATSSPFSSGNFPTVTTTLVCKDVAAVWDSAIASGATPVQSPATNINNITSATLIGPDNYVWVITNNSNMLI
jgi:predicted enzyme related to lactoylglutathione lyase